MRYETKSLEVIQATIETHLAQSKERTGESPNLQELADRLKALATEKEERDFQNRYESWNPATLKLAAAHLESLMQAAQTKAQTPEVTKQKVSESSAPKAKKPKA